MSPTTGSMGERSRTYLPAAGHDWFLPLYDPLVKLIGGDRARKTLLDQAVIRAGDRVLDVGCGTGTFVLLIKQLHPDVEVIGIDPDPKALARARDKTARAGVSICFDQGFSDTLPYPDAAFDRVFSSFMFHHLPTEEKEPMLRQCRRVLRTGGSLHLVDFAGAHGLLSHIIHASDRLKDNATERVIGLMAGAGFADSRKVADGAMLLGKIAYYRAVVPADA